MEVCIFEFNTHTDALTSSESKSSLKKKKALDIFKKSFFENTIAGDVETSIVSNRN